MESECVCFDLLKVAHRSFSNNWHFCASAYRKDIMLKRSPMGNPIITKLNFFHSVYVLQVFCLLIAFLKHSLENGRHARTCGTK